MTLPNPAGIDGPFSTMRDQHLSQAVIISKTPYQEKDLILNLLTRDEGFVTVMARSALSSRRRFSGSLDYFVVFSGSTSSRASSGSSSSARGSLPVLSMADPEKFFPGILESLDRLEAGLDIIRHVRTLLSDAPASPEAFDAVVKSFEYLDSAEPDLAWAVPMDFVLWIAGEIGHAPSGGRCPACGKVSAAFQVVRDGSVVCRECVNSAFSGRFVMDFPSGLASRVFLSDNPAAERVPWLPSRDEASALVSSIVCGVAGLAASDR